MQGHSEVNEWGTVRGTWIEKHINPSLMCDYLFCVITIVIRASATRACRQQAGQRAGQCIELGQSVSQRQCVTCGSLSRTMLWWVAEACKNMNPSITTWLQW